MGQGRQLLRRPPRCRLRVRQARLHPGRRQVRQPSRGLPPPVRRPQIHPAAAEDKPAAETEIPSGGDVKKSEESGEVGDYAKKVEELLGAPGVELVSAADQVDAGHVYEVVEEGEVEVARDGEDVRRARKVAELKGGFIGGSFGGREVINVGMNTSHPIQLKPREFEVFTVAAVRQLANGVAFAPIGLVKMFNSGRAIKQLVIHLHRANSTNISLVSPLTYSDSSLITHSTSSPMPMQLISSESVLNSDSVALLLAKKLDGAI
ncbi:hypothetical protein SASPL_104703 [Salvia splendens]|uniref:Uncharacterized protein n=1 Tax=Salvia splendens TaxID=180675 RepID=A0A8X8YN69_SALSN|nr:hypothetical protein SASPL_104703 [Salvia splendens]